MGAGTGCFRDRSIRTRAAQEKCRRRESPGSYPAPTAPGRSGQGGRARSPGRRRLSPGPGVCQRGEPAARTNDRAVRRSRDPGRPRREPCAAVATAAHRIRAAGTCGECWRPRCRALECPHGHGCRARSTGEPVLHGIDWRVLAFAIALTILTGLFFGVAPALYASRTNLQMAGRSTTANVVHTRARSLLMAGQVAMTLVLLTGAIALGRAFVGSFVLTTATTSSRLPR